MKRLTLIIGLIILISIPVLAQTKLKLGLTGGGVFSTLIRDSNLNAKGGYLGYSLGAVGKLNMGDLGWFVQSGVNYSHEGDVGQKLDFIKVPLTLGLDVSEDVSLYTSYYLTWQVGNDNDVQDFYKETANMLAFGADIGISDSFALGSRLFYGLSNLVDDPAGALNYEVKPFGFDLYLTWFLIK